MDRKDSSVNALIIARGMAAMHMRSIRLLITSLALTLASIGTTLAQSSEPVQLTPGFTRLIRFDRPIATIVIGNPEVADARAQTDRSIALVGKAVGITNLIALDGAGAEVFNALVVVGARDAGKVIINSRRTLHEYWAYRCTSDNCVRVEDRLEYLQPTAPIVVAPVAPAAPPN
jgi:Flp pilus assembly secretin CpaC